MNEGSHYPSQSIEINTVQYRGFILNLAACQAKIISMCRSQLFQCQERADYLFSEASFFHFYFISNSVSIKYSHS